VLQAFYFQGEALKISVAAAGARRSYAPTPPPL
jgi:hypothetical protein